VAETARVVQYMARHSAGQCGPCVFGLRALADRLSIIAHAQAGSAAAFHELEGLHRQIARRGACAHPDGVLEFTASATRAFAAEFQSHLEGRCTATAHQPILPTPPTTGAWR
jgi:NADH:ubiquinone oxidoreductase subunit F (NADH-binding)